MKNIKQLMTLVSMAFILIIAAQTDVFGQLLFNEIETDPPSVINSCQYIELRGTAGAVVPANTYFVAIDGNAGSTGNVNEITDLSGRTVGSNGTITIIDDPKITGDLCRDLSATGTTVVLSDSFFGLSQRSGESFLVLRTPAAITFFEGDDVDANNDGGNFDPQYPVTILDGIAYVTQSASGRSYGGAALLFVGLDVPDAATRFLGNNTPFSVAAYYYGELAASPNNTTQYADPRSANFPVGGMLTPGAPNVPVVAPLKARADFDGDGRTDLSVFRPSEGNWYVNRSTAGFTGVRLGQAGDTLVPGDYDNDNRADYAVRRGEFWYVLTSGSFTATTTQFGLAADIAVPGDYDGDGDTDIAVFRPSNGTWYTSTSPVNNYGAFQYGQSGDVPVQADYDGDGRTDRAVFRAGTWYINRSTAGMIAIPFGLASDLPVPADYDGDNRDDIAIFRPSNGTWYFFSSSANTISSVPFGQSGDVPVPGDYDGDGRDDQAVFRSGNWFLNRSTAGAATVSFGAASDLPIPKAYIP